MRSPELRNLGFMVSMTTIHRLRRCRALLRALSQACTNDSTFSAALAGFENVLRARLRAKGIDPAQALERFIGEMTPQPGKRVPVPATPVTPTDVAPNVPHIE